MGLLRTNQTLASTWLTDRLHQLSELVLTCDTQMQYLMQVRGVRSVKVQMEAKPSKSGHFW